jgi:hypothetical protein
MPQQSVDDWKNRLTASTRMNDVRDEAESLIVIAQRWGRDSSMLPDSVVRRVVSDTNGAEFRDVRFGVLKALYDLRWRPADGGSVGAWWVDLCAILLDRHQQDEAIQVAADDMGRFSSIIDEKSRALRHMGRYDEAVRELQRAVALPNRSDFVSQNIDLALLLCELNRPDEALALLPPEERVTGYGKMFIALVRLTAAVERGATGEEDKPLEYLRTHQADGPSVLQSALLRAGAVEEAEQVMLSRLNDPQQRISALVGAQIYFEPPQPPQPPLAAQWHAGELALRERLSIRSALSEFGTTDRYSWTYGFN